MTSDQPNGSKNKDKNKSTDPNDDLAQPAPPRRLSTTVATNSTPRSYRKNKSLTLAQETTFLNMQLRKMNRALTGTVQRDRTYELTAVMILLVALYGAGGWYNQPRDDEDKEEQQQESNGVDDDEGTTIQRVVVSLTLGECLAIGIWLFVAMAVTSIFEKSKFIELLYWMVVYLPLLTLVSVLVLGNEIQSEFAWLIILIVAEVVAVCSFMAIYWLYPHVLNSNWVRQRNGRVQKLWKVRPTPGLPWTFSYRRRKGWLVPQRHSCKYEGATSPITGLPHGRGRWFDDAVQDGEVVTGWWQDGVPVAPFVSRQYGSGDVLKCVRLAYVSGSDDDFTTTQFWPRNTMPMRCGLAMVECSVSGKFYNNLPHAQNMSGYRPFDVKTSMSELLSELVPTSSSDGSDRKSGSGDGSGGGAGLGITNMVEIMTSSSTNGGVTVRDHVHAVTGKPYDTTAQEIVVKVERVGVCGGVGCGSENGAATGPTFTTSTTVDGSGIATTGFMPRSKPERLSIIQQVFGEEEEEYEDTNSEEDGDDGEVEEPADTAQEGSTNGTATTTNLTNPPNASTALATTTNTTGSTSASRDRQNATRLNLTVVDWLPAKQREVLVFIPGFNCSLEGACQSFGQLLSMTKLDEMKIHPVLYSWPCGQVLTYHSASRKSQSERNHAHFASFLQGLRNAGVTSVHLMSHSMGVQTLLGSLCDLSDGSRSAASKCFRLASSDGGEEEEEPHQFSGSGHNNSNENNGDTIHEHGSDPASDELDEIELHSPLLVCKTLTMLNPDYPLDAFVNHAFASARRLCDVMTIVGDKNDQALFFSQTVNGAAVKLFSYEQPRELQPNDRNRQKLCKQPVIGRCIEDLHFPVRNGSGKHGGRAFPVRYDTPADIPDQLLFQNGSQFMLGADINGDGGGGGGGGTDLYDQELLWLDVDVIDCTGLDTNIAGIRHSAYNLNPVLLKDLTELISSGQRAMKRTSLLYRDGNIFSYAYAPSYVAY